MNVRREIWVVDDDPSIRYVLGEYLGQKPFEVRVFASGRELRAALDGETPSLVLADLRLDDDNGIELMELARRRHPGLPVIVMTAYSDLDSAVRAFRGGAFEFLAKPFDLDEVGRLVDKALSPPEPAAGGGGAVGGLIGASAAFREVIRTIGRLSRSQVSVLITGETGTGKELIARALHENSPRAGGPFVAINTAAIPAELLESELFGHEKGAFTGAVERRTGRFEQAGGGTLFLDEIGDMPVELQSRLLRVLAEGEFYRVGGRDLLRADVRLIAATHQDLAALVAAGRFRADLYHRIKVITLAVPPLRRRAADIPELARHFLAAAAAEFGLSPKRPARELLEHLSGLGWAGNVRELKHVCQNLAALAPGEVLGVDDLPPEYRAQHGAPEDWRQAAAQELDQALAGGQEAVFHRLRAQLDRLAVERALAATGGNQSEAARRLGISRNTLIRIIAGADPEPRSG